MKPQFKLKKFFLLTIIMLMVFVVPVLAQTPTPGMTIIQPETSFLASFIQELLLAFAPVIAALVAGFLIAQIKLLMEKIKAQRPDVYEQMIWVVSTAVKAAEQAGAAGLITEKKQYALDYVQNWLTEKGLKIDVSLISAAIEAAVYEEINGPATKTVTTRIIKAGK